MTESTDRRRAATAARQAREQRVHTMRMRVLAVAVALFLAAWAGLYLQLVSGNDPALANAATPVATQSAGTPASDDGWSSSTDASSADATAGGDASTGSYGGGDPTSSSQDTTTSGASSSSTQSAGATAVTTRQS